MIFFFSISQRLLNSQYFQNVPDIIYVRDDSRFLKRPRWRVGAPLSELPCGSWKYCSQFSSIPRWSWKIIWEQREDSCSNLHLSPTLFLTVSPLLSVLSPLPPHHFNLKGGFPLMRKIKVAPQRVQVSDLIPVISPALWFLLISPRSALYCIRRLLGKKSRASKCII